MKLTQTKDYLLFIDEKSEIRVNNLFYPMDGKGHITRRSSMYLNVDTCGKIIAYRKLNKEAKELDLPELPPFDNKTYWIATVIFKDGTKLKSEKFYKYDSGIKSWSSKFSYLIGDKIESISYDKYTESQSKQFSLEDIKKAISMARDYNDDWLYTEEEIIQSLSTQQLPKEFIPEYDIVHTDHAPNGFEKLLKFKTNSEGKEELAGVYKY